MAIPPAPSEERNFAFWAQYLDDPGAALRNLWEELGPAFGVQTPRGRTLTVLTGAAAVEGVLVREHARFRLRGAFGYLDEVAPDCLLAQDGDEALRLRRLMMPALRKDRVDRYLPLMLAETDRALGSWPLGEPIELAERMRKLTLNVALGAFLALDPADPRAEPVGAAITAMGHFATPQPRAAKEALRPGFLEAKRTLFAFIDEVVAERRATGEDRGDVLSALVHEDGGAMDDEELRQNVFGLIFAGHDTTAHALAWALMLLAEHGEVRRRVLEELERVLGDSVPTAELLLRLDELDRVCRETLRLYPSAPAIPRLAAEDVEVDGWTVPAGGLVICPVFLTQRDPTVFAEPDAFVPDRWAAGSPPKGAYTPFGIGPRWCPGMPFALLEMKEVLATALRRFRFELVPGQHIVAYATAPTMRPKPGIWMTVSAAT